MQSVEQNNWRINCTILVVNYGSDAQPQILACTSNVDKAELPVITLTNENFFPKILHSGEDFWHTVNVLNRKIKEATGLNVAAQRCLEMSEYSSAHLTTTFWVMEYQYGSLNDTCYRWIDPSLIELQFAFSKADRNRILQWQTWLSDANTTKVEWSRPSWFEKLQQTLTAELRSVGYSVFQPLEQLRCWERSSVVRVRTDKEDVYIKTTPSMFAHEPKVSWWLGQRYSEYAPVVLLIDSSEQLGHRMVVTDYKAETLETIHHQQAWTDALSAYGQLQIGLIPHVEELKALGVPVRPLQELANNLARMFNNLDWICELDRGLKPQELTLLQHNLPFFEAQCRKLLKFPIPVSLDHGDLWAGQVLVDQAKKQYRFTDWSDCSITHPFLSLYFYLDDAQSRFPSDPDIQQTLKSIYLQHWRAFDTVANLETAFATALIVAPLHLALMYYNYILPNMEMKWEMDFMLAYHLRAALTAANLLEA